MPMKNMPHQHGRIPLPPHEPPPYGRNMGLMPHPALLEEMRERESQFGMGPPRSLPPHPAILEDRLGVQLQEIQGLLVDNQRVTSSLPSPCASLIHAANDANNSFDSF
ncbi:hypothetical protein BVRB_1g009950 isoform A [Beta vulgaris subsp. vulgaris]|nr:hypothetical protein BVRB_1g009950 isoform A [Beta vulgaris subsp. vulgaris]